MIDKNNESPQFYPYSGYQGSADEPICNRSKNAYFGDILSSRLQRRQVIRGGVAAALAVMFSRSNLGNLLASPAQAATPSPKLGFKPVPVSIADTIIVPEGYTARYLIPTGEPITGSFPSYELENTGAEQGMQIGAHHDGMHFFPIEGRSPYEGSSSDGLLVVNHEYSNRVSCTKQRLDSPLTPMKSP